MITTFFHFCNRKIWVKSVPKELDRKRNSSKTPEIKVLRLLNMKIPHDFNAKNDEAALTLALPAVNYVGTYSPQKENYS